MNINQKADSLKIYVNWDKNPFVKDTLEYPYDFYRAIEYALQEICSHVRIHEKTIWIPLVDNKRYYPLEMTNYTELAISLVKITQLAYISTEGETIGKLNESNIEEVEANKTIDCFALAERFSGQGINFKLNTKLKTKAQGTFTSIATIPAVNQISLGNDAEQDATTGQIITNLSLSDKEEYYSTSVLSSNTSLVTLNDDVKSSPYNWEAGHRIYISTGKPEFIKVTFQAMPSDNYFAGNQTEIPIQEQFLKDIDHFAVEYLYSILIARNAEYAKTLQALFSVGHIKPYSQAMLDIKRRAGSSKPIVIKSYNPY